jgi:hypothetical protein
MRQEQRPESGRIITGTNNNDPCIPHVPMTVFLPFTTLSVSTKLAVCRQVNGNLGSPVDASSVLVVDAGMILDRLADGK